MKRKQLKKRKSASEKSLKTFFKKLGPGLITGASDDDPSGIATYSQTGAAFGYIQMWLVPFAFPLMVAIQEICGRIGTVTGKGLSSLIKANYPKWMLYTSISLLFIANTVNIAADLGAMAASVQMIFGFSTIFWIIILSLIIITLEIFLNYHSYARILKFFCLSLFAYFITAFVVHQDWIAVLKHSIIPQINFTKDYIFNTVAFLGTSISPYLFYWQTSQEVEDEIEQKLYKENSKRLPRINASNIRNMRIDTVVGMTFSQITTFMIVITTAATLHINGIIDINTATDAAQALLPLAGNFAYLLFAFGIIGTGFLGIPILAGSSSYAITEAFNWKHGLNKKFRQAPLFYIIIAISTLIGLLINLTGINPMKALYYAAALNGVLAPPLMIFIFMIGRNKKIMGQHISGKISNVFTLLGIIVMSVAALLLLYNIIF